MIQIDRSCIWRRARCMASAALCSTRTASALPTISSAEMTLLARCGRTSRRSGFASTGLLRRSAWHCKLYNERGVMKFYETGAALAKDMGVPLSVMEQTIEEHNLAAKTHREGARRRPLAGLPLGPVLGRDKRQDGLREEVLPQRHQRLSLQNRAILCGHHHAGHPLLHGRPRNGH